MHFTKSSKPRLDLKLLIARLPAAPAVDHSRRETACSSANISSYGKQGASRYGIAGRQALCLGKPGVSRPSSPSCRGSYFPQGISSKEIFNRLIRSGEKLPKATRSRLANHVHFANSFSFPSRLRLSKEACTTGTISSNHCLTLAEGRVPINSGQMSASLQERPNCCTAAI